jgi:hypothetical protein
MSTTPSQFDEYEQALHHAARLRGLALVRTGDTFALVQYKVTGATLDEIAAFLQADRGPEIEDHRRADLRAMLKAERLLLAELAQEKRPAGERDADQGAATEAALAEIRRRIAEIQRSNRTEVPNVVPQPQ